MKTAISIPDDLFAEAEKLAKQLAKSRSQLYSEAVAEYLARHDRDTVTETLNGTLSEIGETADPFVEQAARRTLAHVEW